MRTTVFVGQVGSLVAGAVLARRPAAGHGRRAGQAAAALADDAGGAARARALRGGADGARRLSPSSWRPGRRPAWPRRRPRWPGRRSSRRSSVRRRTRARPGTSPPAPAWERSRRRAVGGSLFSPSYDYFQFGVTATQLLYDFGQTSQKYDAAKLTTDAQRSAEQTTKLTVLLNVRRAYFAARANKELVDVARETLDDQNRAPRAGAGLGARRHAARPSPSRSRRPPCANAVVQLISLAEQLRDRPRRSSTRRRASPGGTDYDVSDEEVGPSTTRTSRSRRWSTRPSPRDRSSRRSSKQREAQEATLSSAKGGYGPTLSAAGGATDSGLALDSWCPNWNVGVVR